MAGSSATAPTRCVSNLRLSKTMSNRSLDDFSEIVFCDTEFYAPAGHRPVPICLVMYEHHARRVTRYWLWERAAPFPPAILRSPTTLFVAYLVTAELSV